LLACCSGAVYNSPPPNASARGEISAESVASPWLQLVTDHFVVLSDAQPDLVHERVEWLEQTRAALLQLAWPGLKLPPARISVVLFAKTQEMFKFTPVGFIGTNVPNAVPDPLLVMSYEQKGRQIEIVAHELAHSFSRWTLPIQPRWFAEGLAQYLETIRYRPGDGEASMGMPSEDTLRSLPRSRWMGSKELFATERYPDDERELHRFYNAAWLLVHYLIDVYPGQFNDYQDRLGHMEPAALAWTRSFPGLSFEKLDDELTAYLRRHVFKIATARFKVPEIKSKTRPLAEAEVHGLFASLHAAMGNKADAEAEVKQALRLDPTELHALALTGPHFKSASERVAFANEVTRAHPDSAVAWAIAADANPACSEDRRMALQKAFGIDPWVPGVLHRLAQEQLDAGTPAGAWKYTRFAIRLGGATPSLLAAHIRALAARGSCDEAQALATYGVPGMHDSSSEYLHKTWAEAQASCRPTAGATSTARRAR
jgi:hypothetical protein